MSILLRQISIFRYLTRMIGQDSIGSDGMYSMSQTSGHA